MNECPTCGRMTRGRICPYCDEEVLSGVDGESTLGSGEALTEVFRCKNQWQADYITGLLESEGIPVRQEEAAWDAGEDEVAGYPKGKIAIQVEEEDVRRAREIIEAAKDDLEAQED